VAEVGVVSPEPELTAPALPVVPAAPLAFRANFSWTLAGMLAYAACQWGMLAAMARLGSSRMVGQFALGLAISGPVMLLANLELRFIIATDAKKEYRFGDYLGLRLLTTVLGLAAIVALSIPLGGGPETAAAIAGLGLHKAVESLSDLLYGFFQQRGRNDLMGRSLLLRGPMSLFALTSTVAFTGRLFWGIAAMAAAGTVVFAFHDLPAALRLLRSTRRARPRWKGRVLARLALLSAPLGVVTMLFSLNTNLPSLLLQRTHGVATVGVFAVLVSLMTAGHVLINALGHTISAALARRHAAGDAAGFRDWVAKACASAGAIGMGGVIVAVAAGRPILQRLFGAEYAAEADTFTWVMVAGAAAYIASAMSYAMIAARRLRIQPVIMLASLAATLGLGLVLIPRLGLTGAAVAMLGGALVQLASNAAVVWSALSALRRSGGAEAAA